MNAIRLYRNVLVLAIVALVSKCHQPVQKVEPTHTHKIAKNIGTKNRNEETKNRSNRPYAIECVDICFMFVFSIFFMCSIKTDYLLQKALFFLVPFYSTIDTHTHSTHKCIKCEKCDKVCAVRSQCPKLFWSHVQCYAFTHKLTVANENIRLHTANTTQLWWSRSKRENDMKGKHSIVYSLSLA